MTLSIDSTKLNADDLKTAYANADDTTTLTLCLRGRVRLTAETDSVEVLFVEHILTLTYSATAGFSAGFTGTVAVERVDNDDLIAEALLPPGTVEAFQCDEAYAEVEDPPVITQEDPTLRFCIRTTSETMTCEGFSTALMAQAANSLSDLVVQNGVSLSPFVEVSHQGRTCMLVSILTARYFVMPTSDSNLELTITGSVSVAFPEADAEAGGRRRLSMAGRSLQAVPDQEGPAKFDIIAAVEGIEEDAEDTQVTDNNVEIDVEVDGATSLATGGITAATVVVMLA